MDHWLLLVLVWLVYFSIHSLLAASRCKQWFQRHWQPVGQRYRLWYNVVATLLLGAPASLTWNNRGPLLWHWAGAEFWVALGTGAIGIAGFLAATRSYDMRTFIGLDNNAAETVPPLRISALHRFVRHPWYFFGLLILWSFPMDAARLIGAACITFYVIVGSRLEERKLIILYGNAYLQYRRAVPALIPLPWRWLDRENAAALEALAARDSAGTVSVPTYR